LIAGVHVVVQAVGLINTFLINLAVFDVAVVGRAILDIAIIVLAFHLRHFLIGGARHLDPKYLTLDLSGHGVWRGESRRGTDWSVRRLRREERGNSQRNRNAQNFPKHEISLLIALGD
jgi:hypothetical protein